MSDIARDLMDVDILGDDGWFRRGRVVDVADTGFFIDFLCPNRRRELTPFNQIFRDLSEGHILRPSHYGGSTVPVEVLLRETPAGPWLWFPGEAFTFGAWFFIPSQDTAVVTWWRNGSRFTDILLPNRIRGRRQSTWWDSIGHLPPAGYAPTDTGGVAGQMSPVAVRKWEYVKRDVPLPETFNAAAAGKLSEPISRYQEIPGTTKGMLHLDMENERVWFLYRQHLEPKKLWSSEFCDRLDEMLAQRLLKILAEIGTAPDGLLTADNLHVLPTELLLEVFSYLDTVEQTQQRGVCTLWNALLQSAPLMQNITVKSFGRDCLDKAWLDFVVYSLTAPIFKCLRSTTKRIIVVSGVRGQHYPEVFDVIEFIAQRDTAVKPAVIYLVGAKFELTVGSDQCSTRDTAGTCHVPDSEPDQLLKCWTRFEGFAASWSHRPCSGIHFVGCDIQLQYCSRGLFCHRRLDFVGMKSQLLFKIPSVRVTMSDHHGCALFDALEATLPAPSEAQLHQLTKSLALLSENQDSCHALKLLPEMLCALQTADPRLTSHYRGKKWCVDGVKDLQPGYLTRLMQHFLINAICF